MPPPHCQARESLRRPATTWRAALPILLWAMAAFAPAVDDLAPETDAPPVLRSNPVKTLETDLGAVCYLPAKGFALEGGVRVATGKRPEDVPLEFQSGSAGVATAQFDLPGNEIYAVSLLHRGVGPIELEIEGRSHRLPSLPKPARSQTASFLVTAGFLVAPENEIVVRSESAGNVDGLLFSSPLARLRNLALRRSQLIVVRQMLEGALLNQIALTRASASVGSDGSIENSLARLEGPLAKALREWGTHYLSMYGECAALHDRLREEAAPSAAPMAARAAYLEKILRDVSEEMAAIRRRHAPGAPVNLAETRMPPGPLPRGAFESYAWTALRHPAADPGEGNIELLHVGIDALVLDPPAWPSPEILDLMGEREMRCLLRIPDRFRPAEQPTGSSSDAQADRDAPSPWPGADAGRFDHFLESQTAPYSRNPAVLGYSYWPDASLPEADDKGRAPSPAELAAWGRFRREREAPPSVALPSVISDASPALQAQATTQTQAVASRLEQAAFREEALRGHFQQFNEAVSRSDGAAPRIGLFAEPEADPGAGQPWQRGMSLYNLALDAGFPAAGAATAARPKALAYAASIARFDPVRRPWWEANYSLAPAPAELSDETATPAYAARLRRDLWRLAFWGLRSIELDAGPAGEALYEGPPEAGLLRQELLQMGPLKGALVALGKVFRNSRIVHHRAALLEPGLPQTASGPTVPVDEWVDWFVERRFPPLWIPREILAQPGGADVFSEFRLLASPGVLVLSDEKGKALTDWVRKGGVLLTTDPMGYLTTRGRTVGAFLASIGGDLVGEPGRWRLRQGALPPRGVEVLRVDAQGEPDMLLVPLGKGHLLVGLGDAVRESTWRQLMTRMAEFIFRNPEISADADAHDLELCLRENEEGERFLLALNPRLDRRAAGQVRLRGTYARILDATFPRPVPIAIRREDGATLLGLMLGPGEGRLLALGKDASRQPAEAPAASPDKKGDK